MEWTGDDSCYYRCLDPKEGIEGPRTNLSDCPDQDKICKKPEECPTCHKIVGEENDECGCIKFICGNFCLFYSEIKQYLCKVGTSKKISFICVR